MPPEPDLFSDPSSPTPDVSPDVVKTIMGEGDPEYVASVLYNRKQKSGLDYDTLITDKDQFAARTTGAWDKNSKIDTNSPEYQSALSKVVPILTRGSGVKTKADSFYSPAGGFKATWDNGKGVSGPDKNLYFDDMYSPPSHGPDLFGNEVPTVQPTIDKSAPTSGITAPISVNPGEASQLLIDSNNASSGTSWPVYDPYNKVGRNADGSIAFIRKPTGVVVDVTGDMPESISKKGPGSTEYEQWIKDHPERRASPEEDITDPKEIANWLKSNPNDIANKGYTTPEPVLTKGAAGSGVIQGINNVGNSVEGMANAVIPGHPFKNDLAYNLLNRQTNDTNYSGSLPYGLGKFAGETAATAPILAVPGLDAVEGGGLLANSARFVGGAGGEGNMLLRGTSLASKGALQGAETGALTSAGNNRSFGQNITEGALAGAVTAPVLHAAGSVPSAVRGLLTQKDNINPDTIDLANTAINKFGLNSLRPDQIRAAPSPVVGMTTASEQAAARDASMVNSGVKDYAKSNANQQHEIYNAVGKILGLNPEEVANGINEKTIDIAKERTGEIMNNFAKGKVINGDGWGNLSTKLDEIGSQAEEAVGADAIRPILKQIKGIKDTGNSKGFTGNSNGFTGDNYKARLTKNGGLYNALNSSNGDIRTWAYKIKDALDDAFEQTHNTDEPDYQWGNILDKRDRQNFSNARLQYKQIMQVDPIVNNNKFGVSGSQLLKNLPDNSAGDLGELKKIGSTFYSHLDSGTPTPKTRFDTAKSIATSLLLGGEGVAALTHPHLAIPAMAATGLGAFAARPVYNTVRSGIYNTGREGLLNGVAPTVTAPNGGYFANKFSVPATILGLQQLKGQ